jgi:hypothetical protein
VKFLKAPPDTGAGNKEEFFRAVRLPVDGKKSKNIHKEKLKWFHQ